jgi:hypothetical protein
MRQAGGGSKKRSRQLSAESIADLVTVTDLHFPEFAEGQKKSQLKLDSCTLRASAASAILSSM